MQIDKKNELAIISARHASTRFPDKPLAELDGTNDLK